MAFDDPEYDDIHRARARLEAAGGGALRVALLFGSAAVALALVVSQVVGNRLSSHVARGDVQGIDFTATGSIGNAGTYTIRKSVLQPTPNSICILHDNGTREGEC
ncbi:hypothetical protein RB623_01455 [Mesorhizobium sp. LHD-90]|uniref:hypothetical protein n=1 Tax=Mesorhizobium sp. LHD-90 TaxID=3071414 RepID=UPI0027E19E0D|nr:hypothetical protein [Mesorhizobium sp. LHD-90]MDQ6432717.1 hypothetical protein [Mesorhizobium sp. LHD-90]